MADEKRVYRSLYSPSKKQVGCVLLNVAYGLDRYPVNMLVDGEHWFTFPPDDMVVLSGTVEQWKQFNAAPEKGPGPEFFK